jgi:hypothetical protein
VTTGHLDHKVAQAPRMVCQAGDDPRAACRALLMRVINAGDIEIGGGGGVDAGVADRTSASPTASQRSSIRPISGSSTSATNPSTSRKNVAAGARSSISRLGRQLKNSVIAAC